MARYTHLTAAQLRRFILLLARGISSPAVEAVHDELCEELLTRSTSRAHGLTHSAWLRARPAARTRRAAQHLAFELRNGSWELDVDTRGERFSFRLPASFEPAITSVDALETDALNDGEAHDRSPDEAARIFLSGNVQREAVAELLGGEGDAWDEGDEDELR